MEKEKRPKIVDVKLSRIIKDEKQISIRIPSTMALEFLINPEKDGFLWKIEEEEGAIFLRGELIKGINWIDEKKN